MNPLTPLELLDIIEREHGFESPSIRLALTELEELKRDVEEYTRLQQLHIDCKPHNDFRRMDLFRKLMKVGNEE